MSNPDQISNEPSRVSLFIVLAVIIGAVTGATVFVPKMLHSKAPVVAATSSVDGGVAAKLAPPPNDICYVPDACNWSYNEQGLYENPQCIEGFTKGYWTNATGTVGSQQRILQCVCCSPVSKPLNPTVSDAGVPVPVVDGGK